MLSIFKGRMPDITPAQLAAVLVAGVPIIGNLLAAFGITDPTQAQLDALSDTLTWGGVLAGLLIGGDVGLRAARNGAESRVQAAAMIGANAGAGPEAPPLDGAVDEVPDDELPSDEEEFAGGGAGTLGQVKPGEEFPPIGGTPPSRPGSGSTPGAPPA